MDIFSGRVPVVDVREPEVCCRPGIGKEVEAETRVGYGRVLAASCATGKAMEEEPFVLAADTRPLSCWLSLLFSHRQLMWSSQIVLRR